MFSGAISGDINGESLEGLERSIQIKPSGQVVGTIRNLNNEKLQKTLSIITMLNGVPAWIFAESVIPDLKNGYQVTRDAVFDSKTIIVFDENPGINICSIHITF